MDELGRRVHPDGRREGEADPERERGERGAQALDVRDVRDGVKGEGREENERGDGLHRGPERAERGRQVQEEERVHGDLGAAHFRTIRSTA